MAQVPNRWDVRCICGNAGFRLCEANEEASRPSKEPPRDRVVSSNRVQGSLDISSSMPISKSRHNQLMIAFYLFDTRTLTPALSFSHI